MEHLATKIISVCVCVCGTSLDICTVYSVIIDNKPNLKDLVAVINSSSKYQNKLCPKIVTDGENQTSIKTQTVFVGGQLLRWKQSKEKIEVGWQWC